MLTFQEMHQWVEQCAGALANLGKNETEVGVLFLCVIYVQKKM